MKVRIPNSGAPQNMNQMIRQAQKMQEEMESLQADLNAREYDISAGGGMVSVKINGEKQVLSVKINPDVVDPEDVETLEDILVAGINEAIRTVENANAEAMQKVTGGLSLPGMF